MGWGGGGWGQGGGHGWGYPGLVVGCSGGGGRDSSVFSSMPGAGREGVGAAVGCHMHWTMAWLPLLGCWWLVVASLLVLGWRLGGLLGCWIPLLFELHSWYELGWLLLWLSCVWGWREGGGKELDGFLMC